MFSFSKKTLPEIEYEAKYHDQPMETPAYKFKHFYETSKIFES